MKKGLVLLLTAALWLFACPALADDYGKAVVDAAGGWTYLYEEASSRSETLGQYLTGTSVELREEAEGSWVKVKIGRERGYMKTNALATGNAAGRVKTRFWTGEVQATKYARMRKGPSTEHEFICNVNDGETLTIMGKTDEDWYYVSYKGDKGFISKNLVYTRGSFAKAGYQQDDDEDEWQEKPVYVASPTPVGIVPVASPTPVRPVYAPSPTPVRPVYVPPSAPVKHGWQDAYTDYLIKNGGENDTYALIYVNDDSVPELVIDSGIEASGCRILTYSAGKVNVLTTRRLGFTYIPRGNKLCNSDGNMNSYYDDVYEIRDGMWVCIARGEYFGYLSGWNDILKRYVCRYYRWNGQTTDIGQYMVKLSQVYESHRAVGVEEGCSLNTMLWKIGEMR